MTSSPCTAPAPCCMSVGSVAWELHGPPERSSRPVQHTPLRCCPLQHTYLSKLEVSPLQSVTQQPGPCTGRKCCALTRPNTAIQLGLDLIAAQIFTPTCPCLRRHESWSRSCCTQGPQPQSTSASPESSCEPCHEPHLPQKTHLHNLQDAVQAGDAHISPAQVVHSNARHHEGLGVVAEATGCHVAPSAVGVLAYLLQ